MLDDRIVRHLQEVADLPDLSGTKYEIVRDVGRGGMGTVYVVRDTDLGREVALKVLSVPDPSVELAKRFIDEARHLARLEHPNIVPVHDVGRLTDGRLYYVMKLVRGRSLEEWGREQHPLPAVLLLFQKICEAVAFAHAHGVVHRDLKPENLMIGPFGEALVMDWGVAKHLDRPERAPVGQPEDDGADAAGSGSRAEKGTLVRGRTMDGAIIGTPAYMAPEQARGEVDRTSERTDIYGLGALLYFLLSGRPPYEGISQEAVLRRVVGEKPAPLRRLRRDLPKALESICARAMAADPDARYATAQALAAEVDRFLGGQPVLAHRESALERLYRLVGNNKVLIGLVAAYLVMRLVILVITGR